MGPDLVEDVIRLIAEQAMEVSAALVPFAVNITGSIVTIAIVMLGASIAGAGGIALMAIVETILWSGLAFQLARHWPAVIQSSLDTANWALELLAGTKGTLSLGDATAAVVARMMAEPASVGWSITASVSALAQDIFTGFLAVIVAICLGIPMLLAMLSKVSLVLGAACAPLVIGGLAFSATRPLAFGALTFMVSSVVRIVTMGAIVAIFAKALTSELIIPDGDVTLTLAQNLQLVMLGLFAVLASWSANSVGSALVGHGVGSLGLSSFSRPMSAAATVSSVSGGVMTAAGAAAKAGGAAAGAGVSAAGAGIGAAGRGAASIARSVGTGARSAFK